MRRAGNLDPELAYGVLAEDPDAVLVEVRTRAEWVYVGLPDLSALNKDVVGVDAAARASYARAYNVSDGFEGPLDADCHRGVRGWKVAGLPWRQS